MESPKKKVVVVGGGFAGINVMMKLAKDGRFDILLVDKNNYNFFPPLIYQVATGYLETSSISYPFRKLIRRRPTVRFRLGELISVDPATRTLRLDDDTIAYDYLIFAIGAETNYFGNENVRRNAIPMKTLNDALEMRNTLLQRLELAVITKDPEERKKLLTIVVAGGGPTGVEVSGMLAELRQYVVGKDYPELHGVGGEIYLVDGGAHVLAPMSARAQEHTQAALTRLGVKLKLNTQVKDFDRDEVLLSTGEKIRTRTLIWAAGITGRAVAGIPAESVGRGKRMLVDAYNAVAGVENIFAVGDICLLSGDPGFPNGHPQVAQVAIQQGKTLAENLIARENGGRLTPFKYRDKGSMAIIGRSDAVADTPKPKLYFGGLIALLMWLFIHLMSLINYRNRIKTFFNWTAAYFNRDQSLRFIVRPGRTKSPAELP